MVVYIFRLARDRGGWNWGWEMQSQSLEKEISRVWGNVSMIS